MPNWFPVQTKPLLEVMANRGLKTIGLKTFYPHFVARNRHQAYFRSYVFADIPAGTIRRVLTTRGVLHVVGSMPIPESVMVELMARADDNGVVPDPGPQCGQVYRLRQLADLLGEVEVVDIRRKRAMLTVELFGNVRSISIPLLQLQGRELVA